MSPKNFPVPLHGTNPHTKRPKNQNPYVYPQKKTVYDPTKKMVLKNYI